MVPNATIEAEASKLVGLPAGAAVVWRWATGAWSGVMAMLTPVASAEIGVSRCHRSAG